MNIGVISDTHGLLRPEAVEVLHGSDLILHAGDIGKPEVLTALKEIAPLVAVRGNVDHGTWADALPERETVEIEGWRLHLLHNVAELGDEPPGRFDAVVFGHSHKPQNEQRGKVLWFNPGSAGPRRFTLPIAAGRIRVTASELCGEILELRI